MNLAFFEFSAGSSILGLRYMKYALERWSLVCGGEHPDAASIYVRFFLVLS